MKDRVDSNNQKDIDWALLEAKHGKSRLASRLTEQEIASLRKLKKERAIQIQKLLDESNKENN